MEPEPSPPHHHPSAQNQRSHDHVSNQGSSGDALSLGPGGNAGVDRTGGGKQKNSGQPTVHAVRTVEEQEAAGHDGKQEK